MHNSYVDLIVFVLILGLIRRTPRLIRWLRFQREDMRWMALHRNVAEYVRRGVRDVETERKLDERQRFLSERRERLWPE